VDVDGDTSLPLFGRDFVGTIGTGMILGFVDEDIDLTEPFDDVGDELVGLLRIGDIGWQRFGN
jgi:hypothetical protein